MCHMGSTHSNQSALTERDSDSEEYFAYDTRKYYSHTIKSMMDGRFQ